MKSEFLYLALQVGAVVGHAGVTVDVDASSITVPPAKNSDGTARTHYGNPAAGACLPDEVSTTITGVTGTICSPGCDATLPDDEFRACCPADKPAGVAANPQCVMKYANGTSPTTHMYCGLICSPSLPILDQKALWCQGQAKKLRSLHEA